MALYQRLASMAGTQSVVEQMAKLMCWLYNLSQASKASKQSDVQQTAKRCEATIVKSSHIFV